MWSKSCLSTRFHIGGNIAAYQVYNHGDDKESKKATKVVAFKQTISTYPKGGFKVMDVLADNQFECVGGALEELGACLNIESED